MYVIGTVNKLKVMIFLNRCVHQTNSLVIQFNVNLDVNHLRHSKLKMFELFAFVIHTNTNNIIFYSSK